MGLYIMMEVNGMEIYRVGIQDNLTHGLELEIKGVTTEQHHMLSGKMVSVFSCSICGVQCSRVHPHPRYEYSVWEAPINITVG